MSPDKVSRFPGDLGGIDTVDQVHDFVVPLVKFVKYVTDDKSTLI